LGSVPYFSISCRSSAARRRPRRTSRRIAPGGHCLRSGFESHRCLARLPQTASSRWARPLAEFGAGPLRLPVWRPQETLADPRSRSPSSESVCHPPCIRTYTGKPGHPKPPRALASASPAGLPIGLQTGRGPMARYFFLEKLGEIGVCPLFCWQPILLAEKLGSVPYFDSILISAPYFGRRGVRRMGGGAAWRRNPSATVMGCAALHPSYAAGCPLFFSEVAQGATARDQRWVARRATHPARAWPGYARSKRIPCARGSWLEWLMVLVARRM